MPTVLARRRDPRNRASHECGADFSPLGGKLRALPGLRADSSSPNATDAQGTPGNGVALVLLLKGSVITCVKSSRRSVRIRP
jgi:hypothetical protein